MIESSDLSTYTPEQLSLMVECIDYKIKDVRSDINEREGEIILAEDMSECLERDLRKDINKLWTKMEDLYAIRVAVVTNHQFVLRKAEKPVL